MTAFVFPGQGSQKRGMGAELIARHPEWVAQADALLGYRLAEVCQDSRLDETRYTQPALFVLNALACLEMRERHGRDPEHALGHSLGEYNALFAAGAFDFATGVLLVRKRGELMAQATGGGMAAVVGLSVERIVEVLERLGVRTLDLANDNTPSQQVLSGPREDLERVAPELRAAGGNVILLKVSAAFHSRYMRPARDAFAAFLREFSFAPLRFPVISNVEARPYEDARVAELLARQIDSPVRWTQSVRALLAQGEQEFVEVGHGRVLTGLISQIRQATPSVAPAAVAPAPAVVSGMRAETLGSKAFRDAHGVRLSYVAGSMYKGISSRELVVRMGRAGLLGFFGTGGVPLARVEEELLAIQAALRPGEAYGMNLLHSPERPEREAGLVDLFLRRGVRDVEASAFLQLTPALVRFRMTGARRREDGRAEAPNRLIAKVSRPEVAEAFMCPPPQGLLDGLVRAGQLTREEALLARELPMAEDVCVEADSGGHTDQGVASALFPAMSLLRDRMVAEHRYPVRIRLGAAGGIGTPQAAGAAFLMGADFIVTGSINQCTVEAGTSEPVKDLLETLDVQDVTCAPAGDMFELGAKIQVVRKGLFFPARANRLYALYQHHPSLEALDAETRKQLQEKVFRRGFDEIWEETRQHYLRVDPEVVALAERTPRKKMALVFRWYFVHTSRLALRGSREQRTDYQVHCGPAMGAFNQWVRGTPLASWRDRHVDEMGVKLMEATAAWLEERFQVMRGGT
ncbi:[acyl-carrier-protein] S-malonyltransferase [Corallococcus sp. AB030]|uniref:ACP S-malonyltransferase n=1 Tax=Corallococcus TaxID=83461 RepID=UPI000EE3BAED|nr:MULTISPECIES: ACP S-malonyltransferase [Corallococcus]NRD51929.1 ACP S-malonyltransferase [Corallococcus exiguus]RKI20326.1 [acyl-carrier-protein] S-malonyltransferase [Corallococcus sp. AB030]